MLGTVAGTAHSQEYVLSNVRALCTMLTLADELQESYNGSLLSSAPLRIPIKKVESIWSYIPGSTTSTNFSVPMARSYTRMCTLFCSFVKEGTTAATDVLLDGTGKKKLCNSYYTHAGSSQTLEYQLQMGSKRQPDNNARGFAEHWHRAQSALGIASSLAHSTGITYQDYSTSSYCIICDTEKIPHLASSGENLSNTSVISLRIRNFGATGTDLPTRAHLIASYDAVVECRDTAVELFE